VPSACSSAHHAPNASPRFAELANLRTRAPDPYMTVTDEFIRRLAPDSRQPKLSIHLDAQLQDSLLENMKAEKYTALVEAAHGRVSRNRDATCRRYCGCPGRAKRPEGTR